MIQIHISGSVFIKCQIMSHIPALLFSPHVSNKALSNVSSFIYSNTAATPGNSHRCKYLVAADLRRRISLCGAVVLICWCISQTLELEEVMQPALRAVNMVTQWSVERQRCSCSNATSSLSVPAAISLSAAPMGHTSDSCAVLMLLLHSVYIYISRERESLLALPLWGTWMSRPLRGYQGWRGGGRKGRRGPHRPGHAAAPPDPIG